MLRPAVMLMHTRDVDGKPISLEKQLEQWRACGAEGVDIFPSVMEAYGCNPAGMKKLLDSFGMQPSMFYVATDMITPDDGSRLAASFDAIRRGIDACRELGLRQLFSCGGQHENSGREAMGRYAVNLARAAELCQEAGLTLNIENAGRMCHTADSILQILHAVDMPSLGITFDGGNFITCGDDPHAAIMKLRQYVTHVHVKSFRPAEAGYPGRYRYCPTGEGYPDYCFIRDRLLEAGYNGWFAFETEGGADAKWLQSIARVAEICRCGNNKQ